jgi:formylglycine-generating enzyme required for sulfatase activity
VLTARATVDARGRVIRGDVTVQAEAPGDVPEGEDRGLVNADGAHPMMVRIPGTWRWIDVLPVVDDGGFEAARASCERAGKRLPTPDDFAAVWGRARHPWGDTRDPTLGRIGAPRWGAAIEPGQWPPNAFGCFDLGCWLHQWTASGGLVGGAPDLAFGEPDAHPVGFRGVQEV